MQISVTFKGLKPSEDLKNYVSSKLDRLDKYLDHTAEASVVLSMEKFRHIAEVSISSGKMNIIGREETEDSYAAIDMVVDKLEKQIKKHKDKNKKRRGRTVKEKPLAIPDLPEIPVPVEEEKISKIEVTSIEYKPMSVEEAVLQMNLIDDTFMVFTNAQTNNVNVLYRKNDGNMGLIQPNE
jgi:putative sigma-54 modulation protein